MARALAAAGVGAGDRVAIWLPKGAEAVAAMQGVLRLGAAYVPVDPLSPPARARTVMLDCGVRALIARPEAAASVLGADGAGATTRADGASGPAEPPGPGGDSPRIFVLASDGLTGGALDAVSAAPVPEPTIRSRRPRVHSLHVGVHRAPERGLHHPSERPRFRGLGRRGAGSPRSRIDSRATPRFTSIFRCSTSMPLSR